LLFCFVVKNRGEEEQGGGSGGDVPDYLCHLILILLIQLVACNQRFIADF
jgi:hypothetical protein